MSSQGIFLFFLPILLSVITTESRIHSLHLKNDFRNMITLSTFGYYKGGSLLVNITNLQLPKNYDASEKNVVGFSFDKSTNKDTTHYVEQEENSQGKCVLNMEHKELENDATQAILRIGKQNGNYVLEIIQKSGLHFSLSPHEAKSSKSDTDDVGAPESDNTADSKDTESKPSEDSKNPEAAETTTTPTPAVAPTTPAPSTAEVPKPVETTAANREEKNHLNLDGTDNNDGAAEADEGNSRPRREVPDSQDTNALKVADETNQLPISDDGNGVLNVRFYVSIDTDEQEGLYQLFFHNCIIDKITEEVSSPATFTTHITEKNGDNYLSAGQMPLPVMYCVLAVLFFLSGLYWINILRASSTNKVFKIHYLMAVFILTKSLSVTFHAIDYHFIARDGLPETWAIIFYIVYLLKGILLILCLLLVATGWAFIKYVLSDKEKKLFMIIIPLQVIASIAYIIMEGTEEGNQNYGTWKNIMMLVSIVCVAAILLPVVWSIRHLHSASQTDGKAAMNLAKLKLFREFYILVVLYLYFTRIIVYLLQLTLPYKLVWIYLLFAELGSFLFFVIVGYKFRPGCDNPYFQLPDYDSDDEEAQALTSNGMKESLKRVNRVHESSGDEEDELFSRDTSKV